MGQFLMDFSDFLNLFNEIAKRESKERASLAENRENTLVELGLDSMDIMMLGIFFTDWWGVPKDVSKVVRPTTVGQFYDFLEQHKTKNPPHAQACLQDYENF